MDKIVETASENISETSDFINKKCNLNYLFYNKKVGLNGRNLFSAF